MLPGKIATKNNAVINPTTLRYLLKISSVVIKDRPRDISTTPDVITTKSGSRGSQVGTWAWNSCRFDPRWEIPAEVRKAPSSS